MKEQESLLQGELQRKDIAGTGGRQGEGYEKVNKMLLDVQKNIKKTENEMKVAKFTEYWDNYNRSVKDNIASIELQAGKEIALANAMGNALDVGKAQINQTEQLIKTQEEQIAQYRKEGIDTRDLEDNLKSLNITLDEQRYIFDNITTQVEKYNRANKDTVNLFANKHYESQYDSLINTKKGLKEVTEARLKYQEALMNNLNAELYGSKEQKESAKNQLDNTYRAYRIAKIQANIDRERIEKNKSYSAGLSTLNNQTNEQILQYNVLGKSERDVLELRIKNSESIYTMSKVLGMENSVLEANKQAIKDATDALIEYDTAQKFSKDARKYDFEFSRGMRQIDNMQALGFSTPQQIEERVNYIKSKQQELESQTQLTADKKKEIELDLDESLKTLEDDLVEYRINKQREIVDNVIDQKKKMVEQWQSDIVSVMTGDTQIFDAITTSLERIQKKVLEESVKGLATKLGNWEFLITGESPEKLMAEEEKRQKEIQALITDVYEFYVIG